MNEDVGMESIEGPRRRELHLKKLRRDTPPQEIPPDGFRLSLCDPRNVLTPEQWQQRQADLAAIAMHRKPPPDDVILA